MVSGRYSFIPIFEVSVVNVLESNTFQIAFHYLTSRTKTKEKLKVFLISKDKIRGKEILAVG